MNTDHSLRDKCGTAQRTPLVSRARAFGFVPLFAALAACAPQIQNAGPRADNKGDLRYGALTFKPCALSGGRSNNVEAQCARFAVPENHDAPNGRKIELAVALIPAAGEAEADPIVFIAGGPGQSILEAYPMLHARVRDARRNRNVLLVDARGTGQSHPLQCTEMNALMDSPTAWQDKGAIRKIAEDCRDRLSKTSDLRYYGTVDHVRDLDAVRAALGIERFNLVGISYGTRVAQQFAARYPQRTRTVTLDSIAPNSLVLGQEHARNLDDALKRQFARCAADAACARNLGDPAKTLAAVRSRLQAGNLAPESYRDPQTGEWREETPSFGHLSGLLRLYAYQPVSASMLPLILHDAGQGRYQTLLAQARAIGDEMNDTIMMGMHLSVSCTEDSEIRVDPADAKTTLGNELVEFLIAQCEVWPKGTRDPNFRKPLSGDVSVLAISGEFDPVTPPRYGDEVIETLPNGRHLILPGQGHNVLTTGCMPKLFARYLETADAKGLDAECLKRLRPNAPFAGNYGWEP
jgi:pimeloyl-ACP methyl ester carboxylesterase